MWCEGTQSYYAKASKYSINNNGKRKCKTIYLHREVLRATKEMDVDHISHNTLDNRKENLRMTTTSRNGKNRKSKNINNTTGHRNVSKVGKWYYVQLQINGENILLKKFPLNQLEEAGKYAELMREKYYGAFKGES